MYLNVFFFIYFILFCSVFVLLALHLLLLQSGDIHPNPGLSSVASDTSDSSAFSILNSLNRSRYLSFVHYNVQSIVPKLDILISELSNFDILAFSEIWLNTTITGEELFFVTYHPPPPPPPLSAKIETKVVSLSKMIENHEDADL